jgi:all-trans-8'-apo-beta-carotenal 15,15'-oxygenase
VDGQLQSPQLGAHYRIEKRADGSRRWVTFSNNAGASGTKIIFYEFDESGKAVVALPTMLKGSPISMIHDLAITENYYVIVQGPVNFNAFKFATQYAFSRCSIVECLVYDETKPTRVHIVPRPGSAADGQPVRVLEAPASFSFHHANAYELPGERLVLDTAAWDKVSFASSQHNLTAKYYEGGSRVHLTRWAWDLKTGQLLGNHRLMRRTMEFPSVNWTVNGRPHRHTFCTADAVDDEFHWGPSQAIVKVSILPEAGASAGYVFERSKDVQTDIWTAGERQIVNEPIFVPRPGATEEDDGWLLVTVHDALAVKGQLVVLDARSLSKGPITTINLPHFLPAALHGSFSGDVWGPTSDSAPKWMEPNVVRAL